MAAGEIIPPIPEGFVLEEDPPIPAGFELEAPAAAPGYGESALRGGAQGVLMGFPDELAGAGGAAIDAAKKLSVSDLVKDYVSNRDKYRAGDTAAKAANPKTFTGSEIAGSIAPAFALPGAGSVKAAAGIGAALGGATGIGQSTNDLTQGDYGGVAKDAATGAALGGTFGAAAKYGMDKLGSAMKPRIPDGNQLISSGSPPKSRLPEYLGTMARRATEIAGAVAGYNMPGHGTTLLGAGFGRIAGKPIGEGVEKLAGKALETISKAPTLNLEAIAARLNGGPAQKFLGALQNAAQNGQASLAATHFILSQTEPEYQKATQTEERR